MVLLVLAVFILATLIQAIILLKKKKYKETILVIVIMILSALYCISGLTLWNFPAPNQIIENVFKPLSDIVFQVENRK